MFMAVYTPQEIPARVNSYLIPCSFRRSPGRLKYEGGSCIMI